MGLQTVVSGKTLDRLLLFLAVFSALLLPPITIKETWPKIEISDVLLPAVIAFLIRTFRKSSPRIEFISRSRNTLLIFSGFVALICVSILINHRAGVLRDWFEPLKFIKFIAYLLAFAMAFKPIELRALLAALFIPLVVFNMLHYFDVLGFNALVEPLYAPAHHLDLFGLNSLGEPDTKRALGTMGNPNVNGLMFVLLLVVFIVPVNYRNGYLAERALVFAAIVGVLLCQSRTGLIAFGAVMLLYIAVLNKRFRSFGYYIVFALVVYLVLEWVGNTYLGSLGSAERIQRAGEGRLVQWRKIYATMSGYWFFGHAPSKEFFEANGIYAESEFVLIIYRYGIVGLTLWCIGWLFWAAQCFKMKGERRFAVISLPLVYFIGATTNNPMHANKLAMLFAVAAAYVYSLTDDYFEHA